MAFFIFMAQAMPDSKISLDVLSTISRATFCKPLPQVSSTNWALSMHNALVFIPNKAFREESGQVNMMAKKWPSYSCDKNSRFRTVVSICVITCFVYVTNDPFPAKTNVEGLPASSLILL
jgi:hypothetical protein